MFSGSSCGVPSLAQCFIDHGPATQTRLARWTFYSVRRADAYTGLKPVPMLYEQTYPPRNAAPRRVNYE